MNLLRVSFIVYRLDMMMIIHLHYVIIITMIDGEDEGNCDARSKMKRVDLGTLFYLVLVTGFIRTCY